MKKPLQRIIKRNGEEVNFDPQKIITAITKAVDETNEFDLEEVNRLVGIVINLTGSSFKPKEVPTVEQISDIIEQVLMAAGHYKTAKAYILYREQHRKDRAVRAIIGVKDDLGLSLNQLKVLERRYLLHDEDGKVTETPQQLFERVAQTLSKVETKDRKHWQQQFFDVMANMEFLPAGRTLNNAGTKQNQLANCFVLPIEDSMEGIFDAVKWTALIHQTGGGTGFNFSKLRPNGDVVSKSSGGFATGPVSFMKVFDIATRQVMQGGKKRGANMGILNVDHPDIMEFIACKTEDGDIANFNISVGITDEFMTAVKHDKTFTLKNPRTKEPIQTLRASTLMDQIATLAWRTGDPGMIYLDAINKNNPLLDTYGRIESTNPCGEQPLHPFDACNLGSINLAKFAKDKNIDWDRLRQVTHIAVRLLDNVIDAGTYPLPQITDTVKANRRIGLGVMGWADMLFKLGVAYDSEEGVQLAKKVMGFIQTESWKASELLAKEKGVFPRWKESEFKKQGKKVRNIAITTIAPTGTISMVADCSSGIEPVFALAFVKNVVDEAGLSYINPHFGQVLHDLMGTNGEYNQAVSHIAQTGSCQNLEELPGKIRKIFVTAHDINWQWHIRMQAAFQRHVDNAVSKTINLPNNSSIEDVKSAYLLSWELGCKGVTVYRDGSKDFQVLQTAGHNTKPKKSNVIIQSTMKQKSLKQRSAEAAHDHKTTVCPECGSTAALEEGCVLCHNCGWSACSA
jgi:ribonucleoside-diphosphate reductase alpha chain